jgi:tetratricopeptide (TPR) repeat protein
VDFEVEILNKSRFGMLVLVTLIALAIIGPTNANAATITDYNWTDPIQRNFTDDYLGQVNVAYERGSTAHLLINVQNSRGFDAYFMVKVRMSWASENVTATPSEYKILAGESHIFEAEITIPTDVSNLYLHSYKIYSLYRAAPGDNWANDDTETGTKFAVYSSEQSQINTIKLTLDAYPYLTSMPFLTSGIARELMINASVHESLGEQSYSRGDFTDALDHYSKALSATEDAFAADTEYASSIGDSLVAVMNAGQTYLSMQGYAYILAALGFLLIGIGAIVYLIRRSKPPAVT